MFSLDCSLFERHAYSEVIGMKPLLIEEVSLDNSNGRDPNGDRLGVVPFGDEHAKVGVLDEFFAKHFKSNPEFFKQAFKLMCAFCGLQISYLTWGYMQELIMTSQFEATERVPDGKFPSAAFSVFGLEKSSSRYISRCRF